MFALQARGMRLGIQRMREGIAYRKLESGALPPMIQVAGTNGKGSVSAMLASVLQAAGYRTGLFTSPHLHRFTERIRIEGRPLSTREAARRIEDLLEVFGRRGAPFVSFFELSTLMAAEAFRDHACDVAVMEVGLGGEQDATNAFPAVLSVITRIAYDHEQVLGRTLAEIATAKAGIIKPKVPVIVGTREPDALKVIRARAKLHAAPARYLDRDFAVTSRRTHSVRSLTTTISVGKRRYGPIDLGLPGDHQRENAACAVAALAELPRIGFRVSARAIKQGLAEVRWPARLERIPGSPSYLLDAAHNPDGCESLARFLSEQPAQTRVLVFGVMRDKNYQTMLQSLASQVDAVVYAKPRVPRAEHPRELRKILPGTAARSIADALRQARKRAGRRGLVVVAGSIFLVAEARARLLRVPTDPLIRL